MYYFFNNLSRILTGKAAEKSQNNFQNESQNIAVHIHYICKENGVIEKGS